MVPMAAPREILVNPRMLQKMTSVGPVHFLVRIILTAYYKSTTHTFFYYKFTTQK
jgi:hypothetical protein